MGSKIFAVRLHYLCATSRVHSLRTYHDCAAKHAWSRTSVDVRSLPQYLFTVHPIEKPTNHSYLNHTKILFTVPRQTQTQPQMIQQTWPMQMTPLTTETADRWWEGLAPVQVPVYPAAVLWTAWTPCVCPMNRLKWSSGRTKTITLIFRMIFIRIWPEWRYRCRVAIPTIVSFSRWPKSRNPSMHTSKRNNPYKNYTAGNYPPLMEEIWSRPARQY